MSQRPVTLCLSLASLLGALVGTGCKVNEAETEEKDRYFESEPELVEAVHRNRLGQEPTGFLRARAAEAIHWQPWSEELFTNAFKEQKQIFVIVTSGNFAQEQELRKYFKEHPAFIRQLHSHYVCAMADVQAHPELGFLSFFLASEVRRGIAFPMMIWFSHEKNPIAWLPLNRRDIAAFNDVFNNSHEMVSRIWRDDPRYVINNSASDNEARTKRARQIVGPTEEDYDLREEVEKAARAITALYDPTSREMDGAGGLVPFAMLHFSGRLAHDPATSDVLRKRLVEMLRGHLDLLLSSAIRDPLDGGFFGSRRTLGWALPNFSKDSVTQLNAVLALVTAAGITGENHYLEAAKTVLEFAETRFAVEGGGIGLYEEPAADELATKAYLWSLEQLRELLPPDEFKVVEKCYGVTGLGNIPLESDPQRDFFRLNSLHHAVAPEDAAAGLGLAPEQARTLLDSARQRLLVRRQETLEETRQFVETTRTAELDARWVLALVELANAAGDDAMLIRAGEVLADMQARNVTERGLMRIPARADRRAVAARGSDYAMVLDALLLAYRHTLDPRHLVWADQLVAEVFEKLVDEENLVREQPVDDRLLLTPIYNSSMIFGHSTWGVICGPLERLRQLTGSEKLEKLIANKTDRLINGLKGIPLTQTDFGKSALVIDANTLVVLEGPLDSPELKSLHAVLREPAHDALTVVRLDEALPASFTALPKPAGKTRAVVIRGGKPSGEAASAEELQALLSAATDE